MSVTNLTKREIILEIFDKNRYSQKQIADNVQMILDIIMTALGEGRSIELRNFGVFEVQVRKARMGRNPNVPEVNVLIPERAVIKFKSGKILKQRIRQLDLSVIRHRPRVRPSAET